MELKHEYVSQLFSTGDVISICAAIIALSALGISIWQGILTRRHNQISVRPHIDCHANMTKGERIDVVLYNHGVGPALFKKIIFSHGNSEFIINNYNDYKVLFSSLGLPLEEISHKVASLSEPAALYQGSELTMLTFEGTQLNHELHEKISTTLSRLTMEIKYECIYGRVNTLRVKF
ncbi:hypothetical protein [Aeromonas jandaei]|uniref:hypothetical protein n=1 Tax=Aeromonas jandaei TaxID=650 RepID=UPI00191E1BA7|nr:hypothetical protein [Aeromonas jandaei]MBL0626496.1 hypothetical protein [Aeromonas jandaei]